MAENQTLADRIADVYTWLREPDSIEVASIEWLEDWMNRRPIAQVAMIAMLLPSEATQTPALPEAAAPTIRRRALQEEGVCAYCDQHSHESMMPPHDASPRCESGKRNHCSCDVCY